MKPGVMAAENLHLSSQEEIIVLNIYKNTDLLIGSVYIQCVS